MRHRLELVMIVVIALLSGIAPLGSEQVGRLQPGSDPSVLPGPVLIADRGNDRLVLVDPEGRVRWTFPKPGDLAPGERFKMPDDAFYGPDGNQIIVTHEDDFTVTLVDPGRRRIVANDDYNHRVIVVDPKTDRIVGSTERRVARAGSPGVSTFPTGSTWRRPIHS